MKALILAALAAVAASMPSYIAVPADQIAFLDLRALHRVPRQALTPPAQHQPYSQDYPAPLHHYQTHSVGLFPPPVPEGPAPARLVRLQADTAAAHSLGAAPQLAERPPDFGEYVDFGAHTGDHGAFGWYADYPINNQESSNY